MSTSKRSLGSSGSMASVFLDWNSSSQIVNTPTTTSSFRSRYLRFIYYIGLCLLCKVSLIVGDEKVLTGFQNQSKSTEDPLRLVNSTGTNPLNKRHPCDNETLNKCMGQIPPMPDLGIPSTPQGVENACRTFDSGMNCVYDWANNCLKKGAIEKLKSSTHGPSELYSFLCKDANFRSQYLSHGTCFRKISRQYDGHCAKNFILAVKSLKDQETSKDLCCVRFAFMQCVTDITRRNCKPNATKFMQLTGETLIRSTLRFHAPKLCATMNHSECHSSRSSKPFPSNSFYSIPFTLFTVLFLAML